MPKIKVILFFNLICLMSMMAILPVMGPIVRKLGMLEWHSGLIVSISGVFWMVFSRFWGKLSDEMGRRRILLIACTGFVVSYIALALFFDYALTTGASFGMVLLIFMVIRALMGGFYAAIPPVSAARIADTTTTKTKTKAMALLGASSGLGMVFGPLLAGMLAKNSLTLPLYVAAFLPLLGMVAIYIGLPKQNKRVPTDNLPIKISDIRLRLPLLANFIVHCCIMSANMCIGFYVMDILHLNEQQAAHTSGYAMGIVGALMIITQIIYIKLKNIHYMSLLMFGSLIAAGGFSVIIGIHTVYGLYFGYGLTAIGLSLIIPTLQIIASNAVSEQEQGVALGSVTAMQGLSMVITPIVSTFLYSFNYFIPYAMAVALLIFLFFYASVKRIQTV